MAKTEKGIYPKVIGKTVLKKYERKKGGKLTIKFGRLEFDSGQQDVLNRLVDAEAKVKVTIESTEGILPGTQ